MQYKYKSANGSAALFIIDLRLIITPKKIFVFL